MPSSNDPRSSVNSGPGRLGIAMVPASALLFQPAGSSLTAHSIGGAGFWYSTSGTLAGTASHGTAGQLPFGIGADVSWLSPAGDVSSSILTPGLLTVSKLNGATVPVAGGLTIGNVPQVSGPSALSYGPVDLGGGVNNVTGILPKTNQQSQDLLGDVTGTTAVSLVARINGATVPVAGSLTVGYLLQVSGSSALTYGPLVGDVTGTAAASIVSKVHGATVPAAGSLITGNVLQVSGASALSYGPINLGGGANYVQGLLPAGNQASQSMGGAVGGTTAASTISLTSNGNITGTLPAANQVPQNMGGAVGGTTAASTISLTSNASITGTLPAANQVAQNMGGGDITGTTASATVVGMKAHVLPALSSGYLFWTGAAWAFSTPTPGGPPSGGAGGDLGSNYPTPTVVSATGSSGTFTVSAATLRFSGATGNILCNGDLNLGDASTTSLVVNAQSATFNPSASFLVFAGSSVALHATTSGIITIGAALNILVTSTLTETVGGYVVNASTGATISAGTTLSLTSTGTTNMNAGGNVNITAGGMIFSCTAADLLLETIAGKVVHFVSGSAPGGATSLPGTTTATLAVKVNGTSYYIPLY